MKFLIPLILALSLLSCSAQQDERTPTTEDLHQSHEDLTLGHRFFATTLYQNRNQISSYMTIVSQQLLDSFMDSYSELHSIMDDTNDELAALPNNSCVDGIRNRWTIQVHRHGQILGECLWNSYQELSHWNNRLNSLHDQYQISTAEVQNLGVQVMTEYEGFTGTENLSAPINRQFRNLLARAYPYLQEYEEFRASIVDNEDQIIDQLTMCDRSIAAAFANEARADLARARNCVD